VGIGLGVSVIVAVEVGGGFVGVGILSIDGEQAEGPTRSTREVMNIIA
jgi:hypothetical protein